MPKFKSIKKQLYAKILGVTIISGMLFTNIGSTLIEKGINRSSSELLTSLSIKVSQTVDDYIESEKKAAELIANNSILRSNTTSIDEKIAYISDVRDKFGYRISSYMVDGESINDEGIFDCSEKEYYLHSLKGEVYFTPPYPSSKDGVLQFAVTTPIYDENNKIKAVLYLSKPADEIKSLIEKTSFSSEGATSVIDKEGNIIMGEYLSLDKNTVSNYIELSKTDSRYKEISSHYEKLINNVKNNLSGAERYDLNFKKLMVGYSPIENLDWVVLLTIEISTLSEVFTLVGISLITIAISSIIVFLISKKLTSRLAKITNVVKKLDSGDLTPDIINEKNNDEITLILISLENAKASIRKIVESLQNSAQQLSSDYKNLSQASIALIANTENIKDSMLTVTNASEDQSSNLNEVTDSLTSFDTSINKNTKNVNVINEMSFAIASDATKSEKELNNMNNSIEKLIESFNLFNNEVFEMKSNILEITNLTKLIDSIASQTNLLALNASIEAARAGESGKGFAVVADEVKKLANQSKESASIIQKGIENLFNKTESLTTKGKELSSLFTNTENTLNITIHSINKIIESISEVTPMIEQLNMEFTDIDKQKNNIFNRIELIASSSEETTSCSEEVLSTTSELVTLSKALNNTVENIESIVNTNNSLINQFKSR